VSSRRPFGRSVGKIHLNSSLPRSLLVLFFGIRTHLCLPGVGVVQLTPITACGSAVAHARTKGRPGGKQPLGNLAVRSPALKPFRRFPERSEEEAVCFPQGLAGGLARRVKTRRRRFLCFVRIGVRMLVQDGRRAEGLTTRTLALRRGRRPRSPGPAPRPARGRSPG
jgi:hypothetical protein